MELLYLSCNDFSGEIPAEISSLCLLLRLDISNNNIRGPIPTQLAKLTHLLTLRLQNNALSDHVPDLSASLLNLTVLNVTNNELCRHIPDSMLTKFGNVSFSGNHALCGSTPLPKCSETEPDTETTTIPKCSWRKTRFIVLARFKLVQDLRFKKSEQQIKIEGKVGVVLGARRRCTRTVETWIEIVMGRTLRRNKASLYFSIGGTNLSWRICFELRQRCLEKETWERFTERCSTMG
ncbi:Leucine-rich repeat receptor-like protein kinase PXC1 [Glycine max]|nr:Leucine-rich repeat receptor-like protein kinase PXC1 [Glycine max]